MPNSAAEKSGLRWLWLALVVFVVDMATKIYVHTRFDLYESIQVLPFFNFTYARNYGAAFSFLNDAGGWQRWLFTGIAVVVSCVLVYWLKKTPYNHKWMNAAYTLILGGAIGNLVDRLYHGFVVDFLDFDLGFYRWPAFNVADSAIFIGAAIIIIDAFMDGKKADKDVANEQ